MMTPTRHRIDVILGGDAMDEYIKSRGEHLELARRVSANIEPAATT